jgi:hypothetical protein
VSWYGFDSVAKVMGTRKFAYVLYWAAERALGEIPWESAGAGLDDRRGELIKMVLDSMPRN